VDVGTVDRGHDRGFFVVRRGNAGDRDHQKGKHGGKGSLHVSSSGHNTGGRATGSSRWAYLYHPGVRFLQMLRLLSLIEGVSTLILFGIAMPLKYAAGMPLAVTIAGTIHGILFTILALMLVIAIRQVPLPPSVAATGLVAAVLPGGPFLFDRKLRRHVGLLSFMVLMLLAPLSPARAEQAETGRPEVDRSKAVPPKSEILKAWQ